MALFFSILALSSCKMNSFTSKASVPHDSQVYSSAVTSHLSPRSLLSSAGHFHMGITLETEFDSLKWNLSSFASPLFLPVTPLPSQLSRPKPLFPLHLYPVSKSYWFASPETLKIPSVLFRPNALLISHGFLQLLSCMPEAPFTMLLKLPSTVRWPYCSSQKFSVKAPTSLSHLP